MALNFSHRPIFPTHTSEDNLDSPLRMANGYVTEGMHEKAEGLVRTRLVNNRELQDYGRGDRVDMGGSPESVSKDIIDLLPSDPFGMDIDISFTAFTSLLEDMEVEYGRNSMKSNTEDYGFFAGLNLIWNSAMRFQSFPGNVVFDDSAAMFCVNRYDDGMDLGGLGGRFCPDASGSGCKADDMVCINTGCTIDLAMDFDESREKMGCSDDSSAPHEAFILALSHLGPRDLISVERVCRSLCSTVRSDPLLWRSIHIHQPLNERITDDVLLQLTSRAQGNLRCLSLVDCPRITDDGLRRVLESNPKLAKLYVPGCTRLSIDGVVNILKAFNSSNSKFGIKKLRIGGLYGVTPEHFVELKVLLGMESLVQPTGSKQQYYIRRDLYFLYDDERAIDVEICPRCEKPRLVYDCPAEGCQAPSPSVHVCRACTLCIERCAQCGRCVDNSEYEETFCLENLCRVCKPKQPDASDEMQEEKGNLSEDC